MGKSLFLKGVFYGALAGGALSLLDKTTRESVAANCKKATKQITYYVKNPDEVISQIQDMTEKVQSTYEQVSSEVSFIMEKVDELKDSTAEVVELVEETKEAFFEKEEESAAPIH
ncbi:YtxH domain-containing protein [Bacillus sp. S/N-304-OC-R1]|uniref:YtxH domain-containing protein n=1 Tax=Bacillus sp. S/N-304-OC-R1 TaxID=2758034 RepID=UPI001C8DDEF9|nr:YtxH domain-containing protein [Bacillus sp. S/N-304-OC-R1]MBY0122936.1 YtxH domain-containing protein [Bacillus sp. S/N-304-OC-R1]